MPVFQFCLTILYVIVCRSTSSHGKYDARDSMPSDNYGVPDQYNAISNQGYSYARNALDELLNQVRCKFLPT